MSRIPFWVPCSSGPSIERALSKWPIKSPPLTVWGDGRDPGRPVPLPGCSTQGDSVGSRLWVWKRECQGIPSPCFPSSVYCFFCLNIIILECKGDLCDSGASLHSLSSLSLRQPQFMCCSRCTGRLRVDTVKHLPAAGCPGLRPPVCRHQSTATQAPGDNGPESCQGAVCSSQFCNC